MPSTEIDKIVSPAVRREIEIRIDLWQKFLGSGPPAALRARGRAAGYKVPRPYGFDIHLSGSSEFAAQTGSSAGPFYEFSVGVSLALRALCAAMLASGDLLIGLHEASLEKAKPPFPSHSDWRGARDLVRGFSEKSFLALNDSLAKTGLTNQPFRQHLLSTLSMQIESFIVLHELGHHRLAHIQFLERYGGDAAISPLLLQVFELEADRNAISTMFNSFYAPFELIESSNYSSEMHALHSMTSLSRWRLWTTMIGLLFLTLEIANPGTVLPGERRFPPWKFATASSHPPPLYRLKHAVIWARTLVRPQDAKAFETYRTAVGFALADIMRMADRLGVKNPTCYFQKETLSYETQLAAARRNVEDELNALLADLDRHEYENH